MPTKNVVVTDASFGCIRDLTPVRGFYVGNLLGDLDATLAAATGTGGPHYPPGAIVQLVPGEAMVRHAPGFNAATSDWEFFELYVRPSETTIVARGTEQLLDPSAANCLACSATAATQWEIACERSGGCGADQVTPLMVKALQNTDPRCARMVLPADQLGALNDFAALRVAAARAASSSATPQ
jgi:hypothetical protein